MQMLFAGRVPPKARDAYMKDAWAGILGSVMLGMTMPFLMIVARGKLHATDFQMGLLVSVQAAGSMLSLFWAKLSEGRKKMPFVVVPLIISRAFLVMTYFAVERWSYVIVVAGLFVIGSISGPAYSAVMKEIYPDSDRARIMSYVRVIAVVVNMMAALVGGILLDNVSYRIVFAVAGVFGIASALWFGRISTNDVTGDASEPFGAFIKCALRVLCEDKGFRWFCTGIFIFGSANLMAAPVMESFKVDSLGVGPRWQAIYANVSSICLIVGYFYWGSFIDRQSPIRSICLTTIGWTLVPLIYAISFHPAVLVLASAIGGALSAAIELSYFNGVLHFAPPEKVTLYQGVFMSLVGIRGVIMPFVGSTLMQFGVAPRALFVTCAALMAVAYVVLVAGMRQDSDEARRPSKPRNE